jgi:hypothetical protein
MQSSPASGHFFQNSPQQPVLKYPQYMSLP